MAQHYFLKSHNYNSAWVRVFGTTPGLASVAALFMMRIEGNAP